MQEAKRLLNANDVMIITVNHKSLETVYSTALDNAVLAKVPDLVYTLERAVSALAHMQKRTHAPSTFCDGCVDGNTLVENWGY